MAGAVEEPKGTKGTVTNAIGDCPLHVSPTGFQVHHKDPLKLGGDNSASNLMLLQSHGSGRVDYHGAMSANQNRIVASIPGSESTFETTWPEFTDFIFP